MPVDSPRILLVEDNPQFLYLMQRYAASAGCRLVHIPAVDQLLPLVRTERPDLILLDLAFSGAGPAAALAAIKTDPETARVPIYLCSASELMVDGWEEYADGLLLKPVMYEDFKDALTAAVERPASSAP